MADVVETTGKTIEAALAAALTELGTTEDKVSYEVLAQPSNGFLGLIGVKPARIRVTRKPIAPAQPAAETVQPVQTAPPQSAPSDSEERPAAVDAAAQISRADQFLRDVFAAMHIDLTLERSETEEGVIFNLVGEDLGILIGKHGQTLDSLQYLTNLAANRGISDGRVRIIIDIENYRSRREETLTRLAGHLAVAWSACPPPRATAEARAFDNRGKSQQPYGCFRLAFAFSAALPGFYSSGCCRGLFSAG